MSPWHVYVWRLSVSAFATVAQKNFDGKFTAKNIFRSGILVKFEQNRMVRNIQNFELIGKKRLTIFEKVLTPFWKTFWWHNNCSMPKY